MTHLVRRGGAWYRTLLANGRSAYRSVLPSRELLDSYTGFRVVCLPQEVAPPQMVLRGGSWLSFPGDCRSAPRGLGRPDFADGLIGFRVVCLPREVAP